MMKVPVLVNTSFNTRRAGHLYDDAVECFTIFQRNGKDAESSGDATAELSQSTGSQEKVNGYTGCRIFGFDADVRLRMSYPNPPVPPLVDPPVPPLTDPWLPPVSDPPASPDDDPILPPPQPKDVPAEPPVPIKQQ